MVWDRFQQPDMAETTPMVAFAGRLERHCLRYFRFVRSKSVAWPDSRVEKRRNDGIAIRGLREKPPHESKVRARRSLRSRSWGRVYGADMGTDESRPYVPSKDRARRSPPLHARAILPCNTAPCFEAPAQNAPQTPFGASIQRKSGATGVIRETMAPYAVRHAARSGPSGGHLPKRRSELWDGSWRWSSSWC